MAGSRYSAKFSFCTVKRWYEIDFSANTKGEVIIVPDISKLDKQAQEYFNSLPKFVQETIMQSSLDIKSMQDLVDLNEKILQKNNCCGD